MAEVSTNGQADVARAIAYDIAHDVEHVVLQRYATGARQPEASLCCLTDDHDDRYLTQLPPEIIAKDYGCGDPTQYVNPGETVVDLGSGAGKNCYMLAQKVGATGKVIGVDFNDEMLALSRKYLDVMGEKLGYRNVSFVKGKIQDLELDLDRAEVWLAQHPITNLDHLAAFEAEYTRLRQTHPLIPNDSVDVVIANCVLNLVRPQDKQQLFQELYRVLKRGGRVVLSDLVSDEDPTPKILNDPHLWGGCFAGSLCADRVLGSFEAEGFYGIEILARQTDPWQVIDGVAFRSMTVQAFKGNDDPCWDHDQTVIYKGPWKTVQDDDGNTLHRGQRIAVCDKTFKIYTAPSSPYRQDLIPLTPANAIPLKSATLFDSHQCPEVRHPHETNEMERSGNTQN